MKLDETKRGMVIVKGTKLRKKYYVVRSVNKDYVYTFRKDFNNNILKERIHYDDLKEYRLVSESIELYISDLIKRTVINEL